MAGDERDDRRRAERVLVNTEFAGGLGVETFVSDLSEHGVFVHTPRRLPIGTNIELRFTVLLDDPVRIEALGTVVRHQDDPPGMGVQFGPLSPATVLRINDAIHRQRPRDSGPPLKLGDRVSPSVLAARDVRARTISDEELQARTGRYAPVGLDDEGGAAGEEGRENSEEDGFEDQRTLMRLRAVDVEIVDDEDELK